MSITSEYFSYLRHFGRTVPLIELHRRRSARALIGLRHDVDYDLDLALELAYHEHARGFRSSYYLLHSAEYWSDPRLVEKALQLQDFGHEVGLHVDLLSAWSAGATDDPGQLLDRLLDPLRAGGVELRGIAAHGSKACYEAGFINYWCFRELRPPDPASTEDGRTAEGPRSEDKAFSIAYPANHTLRRQDGAVFDLWSISMKDRGIDYHAFHLDTDRYFTDSGGSWQRSPDPRTADLSSKRTQVLMHPVYWRGPQRIYLFLSAARSGSKWLANYLDQATSVNARHEFVLNHRFQHGALAADKRTADRFNELLRQPEEARQLLIEARAFFESAPRDQAEVNVYLERFLPLIGEVFPDAVIVHLHRDLKAVVRSIVNRQWYDTPEDDRHPVVEVDGWDQLSQFAKACWYARDVNESLLSVTTLRLSFERMTRNQKFLAKELAEIGIAVYPRLGRSAHDQVLNASQEALLPEPGHWPGELTETWQAICAPIAQRLGYDSGLRRAWRRLRIVISALGQGKGNIHEPYHEVLVRPQPVPPTVLEDRKLDGSMLEAVTAQACQLAPTDGGLEVRPDGGRHAHVLLGGGTWRVLDADDQGWEASVACYYRGRFELSMSTPGARCVLFCLMYDDLGEQVGRRALATIRSGEPAIAFSFRVRSDIKRFNLAFYLPIDSQPELAILRSIRLERVPLRTPDLRLD